LAAANGLIEIQFSNKNPRSTVKTAVSEGFFFGKNGGQRSLCHHFFHTKTTVMLHPKIALAAFSLFLLASFASCSAVLCQM
jgi:hypothetical protein